jgi:AmmeMemoRadiSam system protein A
MKLPDPAMTLSNSDRETLTELAYASIRHGLEQGGPLKFEAIADTPASLLEQGACFVTLNESGQLRGCIGSLEARRPLAVDVCENAYAAAFRDPRFAALTEPELDKLDLSISVLTPARAMQFESEQDLIRQLRPGVDGLILTDAGRRGTFLPSVWEQLPEATDFLRHLKLKAGLPADHWSDGLRVERYTTISW